MGALQAQAAKGGGDAHNAGDPAYRPMAGNGTAHGVPCRGDLGSGLDQPTGYTEPLLHAGRR